MKVSVDILGYLSQETIKKYRDSCLASIPMLSLINKRLIDSQPVDNQRAEGVMETFDSKRDRFKRLASKRTNQVIKSLEILGHCSNKHSYEYTQDEIKQIFMAIEKKLNDIKINFKMTSEEAFHF